MRCAPAVRSMKDMPRVTLPALRKIPRRNHWRFYGMDTAEEHCQRSMKGI